MKSKEKESDGSDKSDPSDLLDQSVMSDKSDRSAGMADHFTTMLTSFPGT
jgi:hypothetical protein